MKYAEKVDMFLGMVQLKGADPFMIRKNIIEKGVDVFKNDLKTLIKGSYDENIGNMYNLVDKWATIK